MRLKINNYQIELHLDDGTFLSGELDICNYFKQLLDKFIDPRTKSFIQEGFSTFIPKIEYDNLAGKLQERNTP